jgi:hypothetical protein
MSETHTVVVVSHEDLRAHQNANGLINLESYPEWRQNHHECTFKCGSECRDTEIRKVNLDVVTTADLSEGRGRTCEDILLPLRIKPR